MSRNTLRDKVDRYYTYHDLLTTENAPDIFAKVQEFLQLTPSYTWIAHVYTYGDLEVRPHQVVDKIVVSPVTPLQSLDGKTTHASEYHHLSISDTYGVWGLHTYVTKRELIEKINAPNAKLKDYQSLWCSISFKPGQLHIHHYSGSGNYLKWVVMLEFPPEED